MQVPARSQDFCVGGRFEQKMDLFLLFFLSVMGEGVRGHAHPTWFLTQFVLLRLYIYTFTIYI